MTTDPLGVHYRLELSALPVVNKWWHWWEHMAQPLKVGSKDHEYILMGICFTVTRLSV